MAIVCVVGRLRDQIGDAHGGVERRHCGGRGKVPGSDGGVEWGVWLCWLLAAGCWSHQTQGVPLSAPTMMTRPHVWKWTCLLEQFMRTEMAGLCT